MPEIEAHILTVTKSALRSLRDNVIEKNINDILESVNNAARKNSGWVIDLRTNKDGSSYTRDESLDNQGGWDYSYNLSVVFSGKRVYEAYEFDAICRQIATRVTARQQGGWTLSKVNGEDYEPVVMTSENGEDASEIGYAPVIIPDNIMSYFNHLYGLDDPITLTLMAVEAGLESQWMNRFHVALYGPPGCGKSDITLSLKRALGSEAVWSLDATNMTQAGAIKELAEREILPRIVVLEELEKASDTAVDFLLGVLDQRAEIRKVTARANIQRDTRLFAIATINDLDMFRKQKAGALASRFPNLIEFNRPSREVLGRIIKREIKKVNGDMAWTKPTLDFCEKRGITDPRRVTAIALCGREMLLSGEYQRMLEATMPNENTTAV
jgi:AAA domain (dynein-related subfamily)